MTKWRIMLESEPRDAYTNMAIDEVLLDGQVNGMSVPTIRFYHWKPTALSLGYAQKLESVDLNACRRHSIDVVRRITGGRAILHKNDVTYSITAPEDNPVVKGKLIESYQKISHALLAGLKLLGVDAQMAEGEKHTSVAGAACFAAASRYELTANGNKLIGSAQCRRHGAVLQHGSLPLVNETAVLFDILNYSSDKERHKAQEYYHRKATSLQEVLGYKETYEKVSFALLSGIINQFNLEFFDGYLSDEEQECVEKIRVKFFSFYS